MQQQQYRGGMLVAWCCLVLPALASSFLRPVPSHQQPALFHGGIRQHNKQGDDAGLTGEGGQPGLVVTTAPIGGREALCMATPDCSRVTACAVLQRGWAG